MRPSTGGDLGDAAGSLPWCDARVVIDSFASALWTPIAQMRAKN
jgi:hypothetical protein